MSYLSDSWPLCQGRHSKPGMRQDHADDAWSEGLPGKWQRCSASIGEAIAVLIDVRMCAKRGASVRFVKASGVRFRDRASRGSDATRVILVGV